MSKYKMHLSRLAGILSALLHFSVSRGRLFPLYLVLTLTDPATLHADQAALQDESFGGLKPGNEIVVQVTGARRTEIAVGGQPDVVTETSETSQIQYRIMGPDPSGFLIVRALVQQLDHQPEGAIHSKLRLAPVFFRIEPDGKVRMLAKSARDALIFNLANGDPASTSVLQKCLTDEIIAGWFSVPFWTFRKTSDVETLNKWERSHSVSLGTLGSMRLDLGFDMETPENKFAKVAISGKAHFRPLVLPDSQAVAFPYLSNASVEIDEVSGSGRIYVDSPDGEVTSEPRPEFESIEWSVRLHGHAQLGPKSAEAPSVVPNSDRIDTPGQNAPGRNGAVTFRQTQRHVWTLQHFSAGISGIFDPIQVTVPQVVP